MSTVRKSDWLGPDSGRRKRKKAGQQHEGIFYGHGEINEISLGDFSELGPYMKKVNLEEKEEEKEKEKRLGALIKAGSLCHTECIHNFECGPSPHGVGRIHMSRCMSQCRCIRSRSSRYHLVAAVGGVMTSACVEILTCRGYHEYIFIQTATKGEEL